MWAARSAIHSHHDVLPCHKPKAIWLTIDWTLQNCEPKQIFHGISLRYSVAVTESWLTVLLDKYHYRFLRLQGHTEDRLSARGWARVPALALPLSGWAACRDPLVPSMQSSLSFPLTSRLAFILSCITLEANISSSDYNCSYYISNILCRIVVSPGSWLWGNACDKWWMLTHGLFSEGGFHAC